MKYWKDIACTVPAEFGDKVAVITADKGPVVYQEDETKRPQLFEDKMIVHSQMFAPRIVFDVGIEQTNAVHQLSHGSVYTNSKGEYLIVRERVTHTGHHLDTEFTTDINEATIIDIHGLTIPHKHRYMLEALTPHSAVSVVTRQVKLVDKNGN